MRLESLEDRRLLAVSFEFNYIGGNTIGFNDPENGAVFRAALESAGERLGGWVLQDATINVDVESNQFNGSAVAHTVTALPSFPNGGGFLRTVVGQKIVGEGDANGASADTTLEFFFFDANSSLAYEVEPSQVSPSEIDFQAIAIHELAHAMGFSSATTATGRDDFGGGIGRPGTWRPYDQFLSDADGNRFIDADPQSLTAFEMDVSATGWPLDSVGGKGPNQGLFFDGPTATAVYGSRVPLYSPSTFSLASSVSHLDSEGAETNDAIFDPTTHLMAHAIITGPSPQEFTLLEKAIFADIGIQFRESIPPEITPPTNLVLLGNNESGHDGSGPEVSGFLSGAIASDLFDADVDITHDAPTSFPFGQTVVTFTAIDDSGNQSEATALVDVLQPDFGDAPDPYAVTTLQNGARHGVGSLRLGAEIDGEIDGQPSDQADADGEDEDGIVFLSSLIAGTQLASTASLLISASEAGQVDAWIDFNQDGDWLDAGEQIAANWSATAGSQLLSYQIPNGAVPGETAARFRISSAGNLAPTGPAIDGEVEDYIVTILDGAIANAAMVALDDENVTLTNESGRVIVRSLDTEVFAADQTSIGILAVLGTPTADTVVIQTGESTELASNQLRLDGGDGSNTLRFSAAGGSYDLAADTFNAHRFDQLDLSSEAASTLTLSALAVQTLSPATGAVTIAAGLEAQIVFADVEQWRMSTPIVTESQKFLRTAATITGGQETVILDAPNDWQNFLRQGDINNDGAITALDALQVINELGRRAFSDPTTGQLQDAASIEQWPNAYFDHDGNGHVSALDALRVINDLARLTSSQQAAGETLAGEPLSALATLQDVHDAVIAGWPAETETRVCSIFSNPDATTEKDVSDRESPLTRKRQGEPRTADAVDSGLESSRRLSEGHIVASLANILD